MPTGRPDENRVRMNIHVKPETAKAINAAVKKGDPARNTQGKIVDSLAARKPKPARKERGK